MTHLSDRDEVEMHPRKSSGMGQFAPNVTNESRATPRRVVIPWCVYCDAPVYSMEMGDDGPEECVCPCIDQRGEREVVAVSVVRVI